MVDFIILASHRLHKQIKRRWLDWWKATIFKKAPWEGSGLCRQMSSLQMPFEILTTFQNQIRMIRIPTWLLVSPSFPSYYRDLFLYLVPSLQLCFPRRWKRSERSTMHYPLMYFSCSVVHDSSKCFHFTTRKKSSQFLSKCYLYISWALLVY